MGQRIAAFSTLDNPVAAHGLVTTRRVTSPTDIDRAIRIAGLIDVRNSHAWIALFGGRDQNTVAAYGHAGSVGKRTLIAGFYLTCRRATGVRALALVALFARLYDAVAAHRRLANAGIPRRTSAGGVLRFTVCRTPRAALILALITLFAEARLHDSVTAVGKPGT